MAVMLDLTIFMIIEIQTNDPISIFFYPLYFWSGYLSFFLFIFIFIYFIFLEFVPIGFTNQEKACQPKQKYRYQEEQTPSK